MNLPRWLAKLLEVHSPTGHVLGTCWCTNDYRYWKKRLRNGLCADREDHKSHPHYSRSLGLFWCTADQTQRQPWKGEQEQKGRR